MKLGIPVTPFFKNLDVPAVMAKNEIGFLSYVVLPLWVSLDRFVEGDLDECISNIKGNIEQYKKIAEENKQ